MIDIDQELSKYGLTRQDYDACLKDIRDKLNGNNDMDWDEIVEKYNLPLSRDCVRKASSAKPFGFVFVEEYIKQKESGDESSDNVKNAYLKMIREEREELRKERQKLSDERTDYQRSLREVSRKESFIELIERTMAKDVARLEYKPAPTINESNDMVVCLSDLHTGIDVKNWWNTYNVEILKERLSRYIDEIKQIQEVHKCKVCEVVLGGDNISGLIHPNLRLQNNENVIEQVKTATEVIGDFIAELQGYFEVIRVHSVSGNHSRLSPNKEEHLKGEELDALITFCLGIKFEKCPNIEVCEDGYIDSTLNTFTTRGGKLFYLVHGDKDTPGTVASRLTMMTGAKPDAIIMNHRHHNAYDTAYGVKVIQVGCVVGTDDHCVDLRISGEPEQVVIITNEKRAVKCLYDIGLK